MAGPERVPVDAGLLVALLDERDRHHASARRLEEWPDFVPIVLSWLILSETVNTRLARCPQDLAKFGAIVRLPETLLLDDAPCREESPAAVLAPNPARGPSSLAGAVPCNIIEDVKVPISAMPTFNDRDFLAVCQENDVELLNVD